MAGYPQPGTRMKLIHNGVDSCPQWCKCQETNEHIITCRSPKARYTMGIRLSVMANAIQKRRSGTKVTPVWLDYIRPFMSPNEKPFTRHFVPRTSGGKRSSINRLNIMAHCAKNWLFGGIWLSVGTRQQRVPTSKTTWHHENYMNWGYHQLLQIYGWLSTDHGQTETKFSITTSPSKQYNYTILPA